jgi:hypothetical protein
VSNESPWRLSWRADPDAVRLADRHYNRQKPGSPQFVPPGSCLVLRTADRKALWVTSWPKAEYVQHAWAGAWVNSLFRNEGEHLSSDLIRWAVAHTRAKWPAIPELGVVSFVDAAKTRRKRDPGRCYRRAGWSHVGFTKDEHLYVFQQLPDEPIDPGSEPMPEARPVPPYEPSNCDFDTGRADTMTAIYVCIGNSDDKLSQQDWHLFFSHVRVLAENHSDQVYGVWHSLPAERWQNACFGFGVSSPGKREFIRMRLGELAKQYGQDWISWTEAETETIKP